MNFSIIICAYNEFNNLKDLIPYLIETKYRNHLTEVLVVSSGSDDGTDELVSNYMKKFNVPQTIILNLLIEPQKRGKYSAINLALKNCKPTDVTIFLSADTLPAKQSIDILIDHFRNSEVGCVTARSVPKNTKKTAISELGVIAWRLTNAVIKENYVRGKLKHIAGDMMAFKYNIIREIPKIINDDAWMAYKTLKKGFKVIYEPKAIVYIHTPLNMRDWINQRIRINRGHYQMMKEGFKPQVLAFMSIKTRLKYIIKDVLTENSLIPILFLMLLEIYILIKSKGEASADEDWIRISSTKEGFNL